MKMLTIIATILIPLTFITGIYTSTEKDGGEYKKSGEKGITHDSFSKIYDTFIQHHVVVPKKYPTIPW